jgi:putative ABC transport system substrate-binding protein
MMDRRRFLLTSLAGVLTRPFAAEAQQAGKVYRIGSLTMQRKPLVQGLGEHGWVEEKNFVLDERLIAGRPERYPDFVGELLRIPVHLIFAPDSQAAWAAKRATTTVPVVMANVVDPMEQGLVASLSRPGGNLTGVSSQSRETIAKRIQLLKEIAPRFSRLAIVWNPDNPASVLALKENERVGPSLGVSVVPVPFRRPEDLGAVLATITRERPDVLHLHAAAPMGTYYPQIVEFANKRRLPTYAAVRQLAQAGGLLSYGPDLADGTRRAARYIVLILQGANPGDLPIEQPTKFDLVINLKTAKALGLTIPPSLLARADQVIE